MASTRNNTVQDRRAALRDQHKRERDAADAVFKLLESEDKARIATATGVAKLVDAVGKDRAGDVTGLKPAEVNTYLSLHREAASSETGETDDTAAKDSAEDATASGIPAQGEPAAATAGV